MYMCMRTLAKTNSIPLKTRQDVCVPIIIRNPKQKRQAKLSQTG